MHIVEESAEGFLHAFHSNDHHMALALLILTNRRKELAIFSSLLEGVAEIDQALGKEVGLFLFYPEQTGILWGGRNDNQVIAGERIDDAMSFGPRTRARNFFRSKDITTDWQGTYAKELVEQSSANVVQDFCEALGIESRELPCICTIIRGVPGAIVSRAGDRLSYARILHAANALRPHVERIRLGFNEAVATGHDLRKRIAILEDAEAQDQKIREQILDLAGGLEKRYSIIIRPQIAALLNTRSLTVARMDSLIRDVANEDADLVIKNSRTEGIRTRLRKLTAFNEDREHFQSDFDENNLKKYRTVLQDAQPNLIKAVESALSDAGITVWTYRDKFSQFSKVGSSLGIIEKAATMIRRIILPI